MHETTKRYMSVGNAADYMGVSPASIYGWIQDGVIKPAFITPGGHKRFDTEDLDQFSKNRPIKVDGRTCGYTDGKPRAPLMPEEDVERMIVPRKDYRLTAIVCEELPQEDGSVVVVKRMTYRKE